MTEQQPCGNFHPPARQLKAWIPMWPFNATACSSCGDVVVMWGPVKTFFFEALVRWWWDGEMLVEDDSGDDDGGTGR